MSPDRPRGAFVAVVGPSGAGKDTLMSRAARHPMIDPRLCFARRVVTRASVAAAEDHDSLDEADFSRAVAAGDLALVWAAHGLRYGLPRSIEDDLAAGRPVVANLSRRSLAEAARVFGSLHVIEVTADRDILLARLLARNREPEAMILDRLRRHVPVVVPPDGATTVRIDNSSDLTVAIDLMVRHLNRLCPLP